MSPSGCTELACGVRLPLVALFIPLCASSLVPGDAWRLRRGHYFFFSFASNLMLVCSGHMKARVARWSSGFAAGCSPLAIYYYPVPEIASHFFEKNANVLLVINCSY